MTTENDGTSGTPPVTPPIVQGTQETPEQKTDRRLSDEAAGWRVKFRGAEDRITALQTELADAKSGASHSDPRVATLERQITEMASTLATEKEARKVSDNKSRANTVSLALNKLASESKLLHVPTAIELLEKHTKVADDGAAVFVVRDKESGKDVEVEATAENLTKYKLLPDPSSPPLALRERGATVRTRASRRGWIWGRQTTSPTTRRTGTRSSLHAEHWCRSNATDSHSHSGTFKWLTPSDPPLTTSSRSVTNCSSS